MSDEKKHINYTAADIEKYHKGLLSSFERNALEKAALDDPFLADALEGYATAGVNMSADIAELKERLSEKTERGKVIAMNSSRNSKSILLRVAAMIIILLGAGYMVYQFGFNNKKESIAQNNTETPQTKSADTSRAAAPVENRDETANQSTEVKSEKIASAPKKNEASIVTKENFGGSKQKMDTVSFSFNSSDKQTVTPDISTKKEVALPKEEKENLKNDKANSLSEIQIMKPAMSGKTSNNADRDGIKDQFDKEQSGLASNTNRSGFFKQRNEKFLSNNVFRGRVMDANNKPLPFANITATEDSVGTYADANGFFNLISSDSVLNVQVQSVGYANANTELRNRNSANDIVLKEDKTVNAIVLTNKKFNATRYQNPNAKVEEPEPADGWEKYDLYLANNVELSDIIRSKSPTGGEVEVSFDVDKNGAPTNIKVEKSLCGECDKEAMRLVKDGPKWKQKAKKKRVKVRVAF